MIVLGVNEIGGGGDRDISGTNDVDAVLHTRGLSHNSAHVCHRRDGIPHLHIGVILEKRSLGRSADHVAGGRRSSQRILKCIYTENMSNDVASGSKWILRKAHVQQNTNGDFQNQGWKGIFKRVTSVQSYSDRYNVHQLILIP